MSYRSVETSREIRLWIGQIIIPAVTGAVALLSIPQVREAVAVKADSVKRSIQEKIKKD